jgi:hypothetical protein
MVQRISDEEFRDLELEKRHTELISILNAIAARCEPGLNPVIDQLQTLVSRMNQKPGDVKVNVDTSAIATEISKKLDELKMLIPCKPKSFKIERNRLGLIDKVIPEY